jgi:hypothetical protein
MGNTILHRVTEVGVLSSEMKLLKKWLEQVQGLIDSSQ